jgi:hypothetical protein
MANDVVMEQHYLDAIRECGGSIENLARSMYAGFVLEDYTLYKLAEEEGGPEIARRVHKSAWFRHIPWVIKDGREAFKLWEVKDISTVGRFIKLMYDRISFPLDTADRWIGIVHVCPIVDFSIGLIGEKLGCCYHQALAETLAAVNQELVNQLEMNSEIEVVCDRFICLGDPHDRIILHRKK